MRVSRHLKKNRRAHREHADFQVIFTGSAGEKHEPA
jgi:hypothetical protein